MTCSGLLHIFNDGSVYCLCGLRSMTRSTSGSPSPDAGRTPPVDVADALDAAAKWKGAYPYYQTGGAGQAYSAFLAVWSILGKLEAAITSTKPDKLDAGRTPLDLEAIRFRFRSHHRSVINDVDTLISEVERLRAALASAPHVEEKQ